MCPPTLTLPSVASYRRGIRLTNVLLALPVPPIMPTVIPEAMSTETSSRFQASLSGWYLK